MQGREQPDGYLHMALPTNAVPNKGHPLFSAGSEAVILLENVAGDFLAQFFDPSIP
jgi:hypothetical protein